MEFARSLLVDFDKVGVRRSHMGIASLVKLARGYMVYNGRTSPNEV
jgi:hypothetical protein